MEPVTVYVDVLFLVNLTVDYFLLLGVGTVRRLTSRKRRLLLGAAVGAVYSCLVFFPVLSPVYTLLGKLFFSALVTFLAFSPRGFRSFLASFLCFHAASALFAGLMYALEYALSPPSLLLSNGEIYLDLSAGMLIFSAAVAYGVLWLCSRFFSRRGGKTCRLTVGVGDKSVTLAALSDTGNLLTDPMTGAAVCLVNLHALLPLLPADTAAAFAAGDVSRIEDTLWQKRVYAVPCETVAGRCLLPAFRPDFVRTNGRPVERKTLIAVRDGGFGEDYDAVCPADC